MASKLTKVRTKKSLLRRCLLSKLGAEDKPFSQLISIVRAYLLTVRMFPYIAGVKLTFLFKRLVSDGFLWHFQIYSCLDEDRNSQVRSVALVTCCSRQLSTKCIVKIQITASYSYFFM